jgi:hypothetical protein
MESVRLSSFINCAQGARSTISITAIFKVLRKKNNFPSHIDEIKQNRFRAALVSFERFFSSATIISHMKSVVLYALNATFSASKPDIEIRAMVLMVA